MGSKRPLSIDDRIAKKFSDTKYESMEATPFNWYWDAYGATWCAQTFTPAVAHTITSAKVYGSRALSTSTAYLSVRATDGSGHPTGGDLTSGSANGNSFGSGAWVEFTMAEYTLSLGTKYALVFRVPGAGYSNRVQLHGRNSNQYAGGNAERSTNSGSSWTSDSSYDIAFIVYGNPIQWGDKLMGISASSISKVMTVPKANIKKIMTVE